MPYRKGRNAHTKSMDSGQPAHFAHADLSRNCLPSVSFVHVQGPKCIVIYLAAVQAWAFIAMDP